MKKILLTLASCLSFASLFAQITTIDRSQLSRAATYPTYDSLMTIGEDNIGSLVGQTVYFPQTKYKRGYSDFYATLIPNQYGRKPVYRPGYPSYETENAAIAEKYFDVLDVIHQNGDDHLLMDATYLELRDTLSGDIVYYQYPSVLTPPFIIVGYFEKLKNMSVGRLFISRGYSWELKDLVDIATGNRVRNAPGMTWKCVDVGIDNEGFFKINLVLENSYSEKVLLPATYSDNQAYFFSENKAAEIRRKYGPELYEMIVDRSVKVGMSKDAVILSWGTPTDRNTTVIGSTVHEQWVYDDGQYLYFTNDKLTAIQN